MIHKPICDAESILSNENYFEIESVIQDADSIIIGPGMTNNDSTKQLIRNLVLNNLDKNWVIDADGIGAFSVNDKLNSNVVLTPHFGEFSKLIENEDKKYVEKNKLVILKETAIKMNCNILLKGSITIITDGTNCFFNVFGNPGMATAGSGDVLSGIIGANISKHNLSETTFIEKIAISSLIHSLAGDNYIKNKNEESLIATDIINNIESFF